MDYGRASGPNRNIGVENRREMMFLIGHLFVTSACNVLYCAVHVDHEMKRIHDDGRRNSHVMDVFPVNYQSIGVS